MTVLVPKVHVFSIPVPMIDSPQYDDLVDQLGDWCRARWGNPGQHIDEGRWYWCMMGTDHLLLAFATIEDGVLAQLTWSP